MTSSASPNIAQNARDYARIEAAILYLEAHFLDQPRLDEVAEAAGLGPHHFQRLFRRWAGISPKRFGQFLTLDYARRSSTPPPRSSMRLTTRGFPAPPGCTTSSSPTRR